MRATCPDCLARAQAEREAHAAPAQRYSLGPSWGSLAALLVTAIVATIFGTLDARRQDRERTDRARAKAAATAAKHRTHAPEMAPMEGP